MSGDRAPQQVAVLGDRAGQDEADLPIVVPRGDAHDGLTVEVASQQHDTGTNLRGIASIGERCPAQPVVVLGIEAGG